MSPEARAALQRRLAEVAAAKEAQPAVVHAAPLVETTPAMVETKAEVIPLVETRHGKHRDSEAHRLKMRERMRAKRASK